MADTQIAALRRDITGKQVRQLRRQGVIPANIYGHRKESVAVQVPRESFVTALRSAGLTSIVDLSLDGEARPRPALIKQVQRHPVTDEILHIDFYQVSMTEKMTVDVPVVLHGEAPAIKDYQGVLLQLLDSIQVRCLPGDLPSQLDVDVSGLTELEQAILLKDVPVPSGVEFLVDEETMVARVESPRIQEEEEAEAAEAVEGEEGAEAAAEGEGAPAAEAPAEGAASEE
jgi:large subunit ribosomal protein L25